MRHNETRYLLWMKSRILTAGIASKTIRRRARLASVPSQLGKDGSGRKGKTCHSSPRLTVASAPMRGVGANHRLGELKTRGPVPHRLLFPI